MELVIRYFSTLLATLACVSMLTPSPVMAKTEEEKLIRKLGAFRTLTRADAAWDLGKIGGPAAVPALVTALQDKAGSVRANAAASLGKLAEIAQSAVPGLKIALDDPYGPVVVNAARSLKAIGISPAELVPAYRRMMIDTDCRVRLNGVKGLEKHVPAEELFSPTLECSQSTDIEQRLAAGKILRRLISDRSMAPMIIEALNEAGDAKVDDLLLGIAAFKPRVEEAIPVILTFFTVSEARTRGVAAISLGRMEATNAIPGLIILLKSDPDPKVRQRAAEAIGKIKNPEAEVITTLANAVQHDKWPEVQQAALTALGEMREAAQDAIPVLYAALEDTNAHTRVAARNALFRVDPENKARVIEIANAKSTGAVSTTLFDDIGNMAEVLAAELPVATELLIYKDFAIITAEESASSTGWGKFTYRGGVIYDRTETLPVCTKTLRFAEVDLTLVSRLVEDALKRASGNARVSVINLSRGVFCKEVGWTVIIDNGAQASRVEYRQNGELKKVWPRL